MVCIIRCRSSKWISILNNRFSYSVVDILSHLEMTRSSIIWQRILTWREKSTPKPHSDFKNVKIEMDRVIHKKSIQWGEKSKNSVHFTYYVLLLDPKKTAVFSGWHRDPLEETVSLTQQRLLSTPDCHGNDCGKGGTQYGMSVLERPAQNDVFLLLHMFLFFSFYKQD